MCALNLFFLVKNSVTQSNLEIGNKPISCLQVAMKTKEPHIQGENKEVTQITSAKLEQRSPENLRAS